MTQHQTIQVVILEPTPCQASSLAISVEMLETANRVLKLHRRTQRFETHVLAYPRATEDILLPDILIIPGLGLSSEKELDAARQTTEFEWLLAAIAQVCGPTTTVAAACSASFVLGHAGLLDDRAATTSWWLGPVLKKQFPRVKLVQTDMVVADGEIVTGGAAFAQIDVMLHLVETCTDFAIAEDCRRFTMSDSRDSQLPYLSVARLIASDLSLRPAEIFARNNLHRPIKVADLAAACHLGQRTFARRLEKATAMTPIAFLRMLRVHKAVRLSRDGRLTQEQIAQRVGYSDASALRRAMNTQ